MVPVMANIRPMKRVPGDTNLSCTETAPGGGEATTTGKRRRGPEHCSEVVGD